jgi:CheY-like chemotaxis protein
VPDGLKRGGLFRLVVVVVFVLLQPLAQQIIKIMHEYAVSQGNKIHLILLAYGLGGILGDSVARKLKEHNGTKIILISAYILDDVLVKDLEENNYMAKYIEKPILINSLIELVADTIS